MKKYISILVLIMFIIPQVTFASWWNPWSWNIFKKTDIKTQVLENRVKELEKKLEDQVVSTTTPVINKVSDTILKTETTAKVNVKTPVKPTPVTPKKVVQTYTLPNGTVIDDSGKIITQSQSTQPAPLPQPGIKPLTSSASDVSDIITVIGQVISDLNKNKSDISSLSTRANSDLSEFSPYLNSSLVQNYRDVTSSFTSNLNGTYSEISRYQATLIDKSNDIKSTNYVDDQYWRNVGIPDMVSHQRTYSLKVNNFYSDYNEILVMTKDAIANQRIINSIPVPTQTNSQTSLYGDWQQCLLQMKKIDTEVRSSGGCFLESQCQGVVKNKAREQGLPCVNSYY